MLLAGSAWPIAAAPGTACAAEPGPSAVLVVDNAERVSKLCVTLDASTVSGLHFIELAGQQHGLSYSLGLGGKAVCRLDGVGPTGDDCFAQYPDYWGYWHGDGKGGWTWASTGAGSYQVSDGAVEGWTWGAGDTGASHPAPPTTKHSDVCQEPEPSPSPKPSGTPKPSPEPSVSPPSHTPTASEQPEPSATSTERVTATPTERPRPEAAATRTATPSTSAVPIASSSERAGMAAATPSSPSSGPPTGLIMAAVLGLLLAGGGWLRIRARGGSPASTEVTS